MSAVTRLLFGDRMVFFVMGYGSCSTRYGMEKIKKLASLVYTGIYLSDMVKIVLTLTNNQGASII